ncbi:MAG: hypothetical protein GX493_02070 [Firmicutes bacterium]|nr:hypothetical protein [Bacillota bacterium]
MGLTEGGEVRVVVGDVRMVLPRLAETDGRFDLVLVDPPYEKGLAAETLALLVRGGLLTPEGLCVVEHRSTETVLAPEGLVLVDRRVYGDTAVSFFRAEA